MGFPLISDSGVSEKQERHKNVKKKDRPPGCIMIGYFAQEECFEGGQGIFVTVVG